MSVAPGCGGDETRTTDEPYAGEAWPVAPRPIAVPPGGLGLVTDSLGDTISLIDLGTGARVGTRVVGRNPVDVDGPHHVAVDRAGGAAYVALSYPVSGGGAHQDHGSSQALGWVQRLSLADLSVVSEVRVDANPGDLAVSDDGRRIVVSHFDVARLLDAGDDPAAARARLAVLDGPAMAEAEGSAAPPPRLVEVCAAPHGIALSRPDGATAYVACYGEDAIAVVDVATGDVERVPVGPGTIFGTVAYGPYAMVLSPDGANLAVTSLESRDVRFFDVASRAMADAEPIVTRGAPYFPAWSADGDVLWIPVQTPDSLLRVDRASGDVEERLLGDEEGCARPHEVERLDDDRIAVVCEGDHVGPGSVVLLDATTLETLSVAEVGIFPDALERVMP